MTALFQQLQQYLSLATLITGIVIGAALVLLLQLIFAFIMKHWKPILLLTASLAAVSLLILAVKGGF